MWLCRATTLIPALRNAFAQALSVDLRRQLERLELGGIPLRAAARQCSLVRLTPLGIDQSDEFIKTLFVPFGASTELQNGSEIIREAANDSSHYRLKPHLSLLYKNLPAATRRQLAASIRVPFTDVTFHAIKAVRCVSPTECGADVEAWRVVAQASLSGDRA